MISALSRMLTLRRSLQVSFVLMAAITALTLYVSYRMRYAQTLAVIREDEIARCQGLGQGIRSVAEEALDEGIPYAVVAKLVERGLEPDPAHPNDPVQGVVYIRVERINGTVVAETAVAAIPPRPRMAAGVAAFPNSESPLLYDIAIPLGSHKHPTGFVRIGLAESVIRQRALSGAAVLRETAIVSSMLILASSLVGFFFIGWVYRRAQVQEDRLRERERQAYLGTVAAGIVHDVRHPLGSIQLGIDLAREDIHGERIDSAAKRLSLLGDEFKRAQFALDSFRDYAMQGEFKPVPGDLRSLVDDVVHLVRNSFAAKNISLRVEGPALQHNARTGSSGGGGCIVPVDPSRFKQAILNLLLNAAEAMGAGGRLNVKLDMDNSGAWIEVLDTGKGISKEMLGEIFQPYYTTKSRGMGIGLSIVKQAVEEHGGDVSVFSGENGTVFRLFFPAQ